jgi:hypothetical protein
MNYPLFHEAEAQLRDFLRSNEWPAEIIWIRPSDVAALGGSLILHPSMDGRPYSIKTYQIGVEHNLGVQLQAVCLVGIHSYCAVWVPSDTTEAEYALLPQGLKLSVPTEHRHGKIVRGRMRWWWQRRKATAWESM